MTPEAQLYLDKARQCLSNAQIELEVGVTNDAGRNAYLAAFHAARAFIFERTGKVTKTHGGVHTEFARLAKDEVSIDKSLPVFLIQAYSLKSVADYETGPDAFLLPERTAAAIETARRFVACIDGVIAKSVSLRFDDDTRAV